MPGVIHQIGCRNTDCAIGMVNAEVLGVPLVHRPSVLPDGASFEDRRVVSELGVPHVPGENGTKGDVIRCQVCDKAMSVIFHPVSVGRRRSGRSEIEDGVVVESSDVCRAGREILGADALRHVRPGETAICEISTPGGDSIGVAATVIRTGRKVSLVRADGEVRGKEGRGRGDD